MSTPSVLRFAAAFAAIALFGVPAVAQDYLEAEPNDPCQSAQPIGSPPGWPLFITGELTPTGGEPPGDVDFFIIQADEGMRLRAGLRADESQPVPLADPYLGLFDSNCNLLDFNDDYLGLNSRLDFVVPPGSDGIFILAASGCCDGGFDGSHGQVGAYRLRVSIPPEPVQAITGRLIDAVTGEPLSGIAPPFATVELIQCLPEGCFYFAANATPDEFGVFTFETNFSGSPLDPGQYLVRAYAAEYTAVEIGPFAAAPGDTVQLGDIALQPPPYLFENVVPCDDVPARGGRCAYTVDIRNNTDQAVRGLGWSLVNANGGTTPLGFSIFPAGTTRHVRVGPNSTQKISFAFSVPAGVADGTVMCTDAWFSDRETAYFGTLRNEALFCIMKQQSRYAVVDAKAVASILGLARGATGSRQPGPSRK